jgi:hypothetical protein
MTTPSTFYDHAMIGYDDGSPGETPSLQAASQLWSTAASGGYRAGHSVLGQTQIAPGNGRSQRDAERVLPGTSGAMFPTTNGVADPTNQAQQKLRLAGDLPI